MSYNRDGQRHATCVFEAALWNRSVKVECSCGHSAHFQPHGLWALFEKRHWRDEFREMRGRFYCSRCKTVHRRKVRPKRVTASNEPPTIDLPMPEERHWKRTLNQFRA